MHKRLFNSVSVRIGKAITSLLPFRFIWLQDRLVSDVIGAVINKKVSNVSIEMCFESECQRYPKSMSAFSRGVRSISYQEAYIVKVDNSFLSPMSGLCWRPGEYYTQSVGNVASCFGYRTAFRQVGLMGVRKPVIIDSGVVVTNPKNISHFLLEDLPGLIQIAKHNLNITIVTRTDTLTAIIDVLKKYFSSNFIILRTDDIVQARKGYFITRCEEPPFFRKSCAILLREFILGNEVNKNNVINTVIPDKVYISRVRSPIRAIENEQELEDCLRARGFYIAYLEELSFDQQVNVLKNSKIVIGLHGAGLTNLLWAKDGCHVVEIFPLRYFNAVFELLSHSLEFSYQCIFCEASARSAYGKVNIDKVVNLIEETK